MRARTGSPRVPRGAFTLVEALMVTCIVSILAIIAIPNFVKYRAYAARNICIQNQSKIESIKQTWGLENGKKMGDEPLDSDLFGANSYMRTKPPCPSGGTYSLNPLGVNAACSLVEHTP